MDLRGFGESGKHDRPPAQDYPAAAQARSIAGLIAELSLDSPVLTGYDVGSRMTQAVAFEFSSFLRCRESWWPRRCPSCGPSTTRCSPRAWPDRLVSFFADVDLRDLDGAGHFVPIEAPEAFAAAILERCR